MGVTFELENDDGTRHQLFFLESESLPDGWEETVVDGEPFYVNKSGEPWTSPDGTKVPHGEGTHTRPPEAASIPDETTPLETYKIVGEPSADMPFHGYKTIECRFVVETRRRLIERFQRESERCIRSS